MTEVQVASTNWQRVRLEARSRRLPRAMRALAASCLLLLAGCSSPLPAWRGPSAGASPASPADASPGSPSGPSTGAAPQVPAAGSVPPARAATTGTPATPDWAPAAPVVRPTGSLVASPRYLKLPPPAPSRNMAEVRLQAARRLVAAHPDSSYMSVPVQPLLAIPVLKIFLNVDGSVRNVMVLRQPRQALHTVQQAIDAVHRAAPFGDMSRVPGPWEFTETFLFEENGKFKPMVLDN